MKYQFAPAELAFCAKWLPRLYVVAKANKEETYARTVAKMKHKFSGNPHYVWLGQKEKDALCELVLYTLEQQVTALPTDEGEAVKSLAKKLTGRTDEHANPA